MKLRMPVGVRVISSFAKATADKGGEGRPVRAPGLQEMPSMGRRILNAGKAVVRSGVAVARGEPLLIGKEEVAARLEICRGCEWFVARIERCASKKCGCYLRAKTALRAERCPELKW